MSALNQFYLNDWYVDVAGNRLQRGAHDVKIEAKVMEVLAYLASRSGELVTREELERDVWAGRIVGYESLTSTINKLRKALNDNSRDPHYIETVSKKGYRLIATVKPDEGAPVVASDTLPAATKTNADSNSKPVFKMVLSGVGMGFLLVLVWFVATHRTTGPIQTTIPESVQRGIGTPSIVVLPFVDISSDVARRYLGEGITEDVTTALSKLSGVFVIARSTAMNYKDRKADVKEIATSLHVQYILEGSVQREGDKMRVSAKLIDGKTGFNVWAEQYDRDVSDIFTVQDTITTKIVNALSIKLTEQEKQRAARQYTINFAAYDLFLQGQVYYIHRTREDNLRARELYLRSIKLDANFARAYSANALTYVSEYRYGWHNDKQNTLAIAQKLAEKAVAIDDQLPQSYYVLGFVYLQQRNYDQAITAAKKAIELSPNFADGYATLGVSYLYDGDPETGLQMMQQAMQLNPQYPAPYASAMGQALYFLHRYDQALPVLKDAVERNANLLTAQVFLIATLNRLGQKDETNWAALQFKSLLPEFKVEDVAEMFPIKDKNSLQEIMNDLRGAGL